MNDITQVSKPAVNQLIGKKVKILHRGHNYRSIEAHFTIDEL